MRETVVETRLRKKVKAKGGWAVKMSPVGTNGLPDRIILAPGGKIAFVETKAPGGKPRPLQLRQMKRLSALGFRCFLLDTPERVDMFIEDFFEKDGESNDI